jgi:hypothetical protein
MLVAEPEMPMRMGASLEIVTVRVDREDVDEGEREPPPLVITKTVGLMVRDGQRAINAEEDNHSERSAELAPMRPHGEAAEGTAVPTLCIMVTKIPPVRGMLVGKARVKLGKS